jgi:hypothetical protein
VVQVGLRRANVVWKREGTRVLIMAKGGIYSLNEKGAEIWEALEGDYIPPEDPQVLAFIRRLKHLDLLEEVEV